MKLSISHIAWPFEQEAFFLERLKGWGCSGLEIAPNRLWQDPVQASTGERVLFKRLIQRSGLEVSALHALLYNQR